MPSHQTSLFLGGRERPSEPRSRTHTWRTSPSPSRPGARDSWPRRDLRRHGTADALTVLCRIQGAYDASARVDFFEFREQADGAIQYVDHANAVRGALHALPGGKVDLASLGPYFRVQKWYGATGPHFRLQRGIALHDEGREIPDTATLRENFGLSAEDTDEAPRVGSAEHDYDRLTAFLAERGVTLDIVVKGG